MDTNRCMKKLQMFFIITTVAIITSFIATTAITSVTQPVDKVTSDLITGQMKRNPT